MFRTRPATPSSPIAPSLRDGCRRSARILGILALAGCGPPAIDGGFDSANPAAQLYAIERAAKSGDRSAVPDLIELLDSDDPAVRLLAITALSSLTGETLGYDPAADDASREVAIRRWVAYDPTGAETGG